VVFFETPQRVPSLRLIVDNQYTRGIVTQAALGQPVAQVNVGRYPFDEFVVSRLLGKRGDLILHASCVSVDGVALLFLGHSGAGKSTIASLLESEGATVLSDDRTIVTFVDGAAEAWGTPWHGSGRRALAARAPIRGMFLLEQSKTNELSVLPPAAAIKELFVRLIQPRVRGDEVGRALDTLAQICQGIPVQRFRFERSSAAAQFILANS
jgi:hypothetical protein